MCEITASVCNLRMDTSHLASGLVAVLGAMFLFGQTTLGLGQLLFILGEEAWVAYLLATIQHHDVMQAQIYAHLSCGDGQWRDLFFEQDADKVAPGSIAAEGDGC